MSDGGGLSGDGEIIDGRYKLIRRLGFGGMGDVYQAEHLLTGRQVALKILRNPLSRPELEYRFKLEARALGGLASRHIVQVHDATRAVHYLVMELLAGTNLAAVIAGASMGEDLALHVGMQMVLGLAEAHRAGVVHRDIKPSNAMLVRQSDGEVVLKLVDFGVATMAVRAPPPERRQRRG